MAAGIETRLWSMEDVVRLIEMSRIACGWIDVGRLGRRLSSRALAERRQRFQNLLHHTVYHRIVGILFEIVDEDAADELLRSLSLAIVRRLSVSGHLVLP